MSEANTTVLVADDDSTIRRNLVRLLQFEGYQTIEAADGDEALAGVRAQNPDAVLLDLKMPGRDGLKVLAELQPILADLPVIVITALGGSSAAIEAMRRGALRLPEQAVRPRRGAADPETSPETTRTGHRGQGTASEAAGRRQGPGRLRRR